MLLEVEHLRVAFRMDGRRSVPVRDVSFAIPGNGRVALVGESGCGKSLTALALGGLVDRAEISGTVKGSPRIAYIFQNPMQSLNPVMRVERQIEEGFKGSRVQGFKSSRVQGFKSSRVQGFKGSRVQGFKGSRVQEFKSSRVQGFKGSGVRELLEAVGLPEGAARKYPCEMSGGQQQRVMIAMALAQDPELLIADEPTTALDVTTQQEVLDLVNRIADARKMSVLLITHNLGLVARYSDFVNVMYAGEIVESGEVRKVLKSPRHPYTQGLLAAVPTLDAPKDAPLRDIPGTVPPPTDWPTGCAFHPRCPFARPGCSSPDFTGCPRMADGTASAAATAV